MSPLWPEPRSSTYKRLMVQKMKHHHAVTQVFADDLLAGACGKAQRLPASKASYWINHDRLLSMAHFAAAVVRCGEGWACTAITCHGQMENRLSFVMHGRCGFTYK